MENGQWKKTNVNIEICQNYFKYPAIVFKMFPISELSNVYVP